MATRSDSGALEVHERRRRLTHLLHIKPAPGPRGLAAKVEQLREHAARYRAQAILLNRQLARLEIDHEALRGMRGRIVATSARLDSAVEEIDAVTKVDAQLDGELG